MKTLNEKVAETVKSNNATMGNVEELTKVLKQEENLWIGYALVIRISCKRIHEFIHLLTYALVY